MIKLYNDGKTKNPKNCPDLEMVLATTRYLSKERSHEITIFINNIESPIPLNTPYNIFNFMTVGDIVENTIDEEAIKHPPIQDACIPNLAIIKPPKGASKSIIPFCKGPVFKTAL